MPENQASTTELLVTMARGAGPLQRQVEDQLRAAIRSGRLVDGERLPASRVLAADLGVSRGVISDAYMQLAAEGWLVVAPRTSPRVAPAAADRPGGGDADGRRSGAGGLAASRGGVGGPGAGGLAASRGDLAGSAALAPVAAPALPPVRYDLRPGRPDLARFPRADWVRSLGAAVRDAGVAELDYPPIAGAVRLREVLVAYRGRVRGAVARAGDVILCAGAGQAFVTIAESLLGGGRDVARPKAAAGPVRLAVEDPGHEGIRDLFARRGLQPVPVRVDEAGIVVSELPDGARAVLVTPAHQFPTGVVLSAERRAALLRWAEERGALIVEDDYDAEYRYDRAPIGALQGLRPDLVAHVGSVSKTLAPALRMGWLIAPAAWRERLLEARESLDHGLPALEQLALADFITRGAYDRHLRRSGRAYRHRRDALIAALTAALPGATVTGAAAGLHIAVHIPGADEPALVRACREAGVVLDGITPHRVAPGPSGLLISFAAVPDAAAGHVAELIASARG
jgi:GntR family transcriptional regulator/MocR family aminotransferase